MSKHNEHQNIKDIENVVIDTQKRMLHVLEEMKEDNLKANEKIISILQEVKDLLVTTNNNICLVSNNISTVLQVIAQREGIVIQQVE